MYVYVIIQIRHVQQAHFEANFLVMLKLCNNIGTISNNVKKSLKEYI